MRRRLITVVTLVSILAGCGGSGDGADSVDSGSAPSEPADTTTSPTWAPGGEHNESADSAPLIDAFYPECAEVGILVLEYLTSGEENGVPELAQNWATTRASILGQPQQVQEDLAQAAASDAIESCDAQQAAAEEEAMASAEALEAERQEEAEREEAEAEARDRKAAYAVACAQRGGYVSSSGNCLADYPGWPAQIVTLNRDGSFNQSDADTNRTDCELLLEDARISAQQGFPWAELPVFHADTGICVLGAP